VMDFPKDKNALDINDEYMFGKSLLVSPVTNAMYVKPGVSGRDSVQVEDFSNIKSKETYLPAGAEWYDFWTGEKSSGGNKVTKQTPLDIIPLYVKAGSIIPMGPLTEYATEKPNDTIELRIYPGADGAFTFYEDENDNYNYEKGQYSTFTIKWDDKNKKLTISDIKGKFNGMLKNRLFNVVLVKEGHGADINTINTFDKSIKYHGKLISLNL